MLVAVVSITLLGLGLGGGLSLAAHYLRVKSDPLTDELENLMPGLNCGQCNFPGCRPAAEALARGEAGITLCPPGGRPLAEQLAEKLAIPADLSAFEERPPGVVIIEEEGCIGCTKCLQVCGTDAIIGAPRQMHTVIAAACTDCGKCIAVCPTDCIVPVAAPQTPVSLQDWYWPRPDERARTGAA